jgi:hypothetical protein
MENDWNLIDCIKDYSLNSTKMRFAKLFSKPIDRWFGDKYFH